MTHSDLQELLRCSRDPWYFLTTHVKTQDPAQGTLAFPEFPYLRDLLEQALQHRFLLVPKSRQMMVTWTMIALTLWRALFRQPGVYLFLSRNERCAEELLDRARFIVAQLPDGLRPKFDTNNRSELEFAGLHTRLLSLPATPDGPRMYSPSAVFWDEMAFTPFDEQIWTALKPALDSGGSFVGVSSSGGALNLFARLVSDFPPGRVLNKHSGGPGGVKLSADFPPGLPGGSGGVHLPSVSQAANTSRAGSPDPAGIPETSHPFHLHRIHYSQHPHKNEHWKSTAARGLSLAQWNREQEISFESTADLVYSEFDPVVHILKERFVPRKEWPLYRTIDFGYRRPFVLWLQRLPAGEFVVFAEWEGKDATTEAMHAALLRTDLIHGLHETDFNWTSCDPAGAAAQDSGLSPVDYLTRHGIKLRYRASRILPGVERVKAALRDATGKLSLFISPHCAKLLLDLSRYRWSANKEEPLKDGDSDHSLDALRYFFVNLDSPEDRLPAAPRIARW